MSLRWVLHPGNTLRNTINEGYQALGLPQVQSLLTADLVPDYLTNAPWLNG